MTEQNPMDRHIKTLFENYEPKVSDGTWEKIQARRNRDEDRPFAFWLNSRAGKMAAAVLLMILLGGSALVYHNFNKRDKTEIAEQKLPVENKTGLKDQASPSTSNNNEPITNAEQKNNNQPVPANASADKEKNTVQDDLQVAENNTTGSKSNTNIAAKKRVTILGATTAEDNNTAGNEAKSKKLKVKNNLAERDEKEIAQNDELILKNLWMPLSPLSYHKKERTTINRLSLKNLFIPCPEAEKNAAANKTYAEMYAGPDYAFRKLSDTGSSDYLQVRKQSSKTSFAYSAGLRYNRVFKNGMSVRAGINYSQVNEKFSHEQGNIVHLIYIINSHGDTTGSYYSNATRYLRSTNKFRSVDIPLAMGYEMGNGNLHLNINAGPVINIHSWQKGFVVDRNGKVQDISSGKDGAASAYGYRSNVGIGFMGAVSFYYKMNETMHLLAEPYFRHNFSTVSKPDETLQQRHHNAGLRLGLRLDL
ncbi:MAG: hypothetical protein WAT19_12280 [Ferruginibacter sp.]